MTITIATKTANKGNGKISLYLSFPYNKDLIDIIRSFPTRYWLNDTKEWEVPVNRLSDIMNFCANTDDIEVQLTGDLRALEEELTPKKSVPLPKDFEFKTKPFEHQIAGFQYGLDNDCWLLGDEQGLGKTKQVIDIAVAKKMLKGYKHCLIICGVNGLKWNWQNEIETHSNETGWILGQRTNTLGKVRIGSTSDKLYDLKHLPDSYFLITNVESLRDADIADEIAKLCKNGTIGMVAVDEIHKCKNPTSQQGKGMLKVKSDCRIAMTGTPLMNTPLDLFIILKWLGYENHSYTAFKSHHCTLGGYGGYEIIGYKNLPELQERLDDIMLRRLKDDVLDLPEKIFIDEYVELTPKQAQIYKEVYADVKANIDQIKIAPNPLAQLIRLRQATGYTGILSSTIAESAKLDRMEELVEESIADGRQVVIFSNWTQMTDVIYNRLAAKYPIGVITGETNDNARQGIVEGFQKGLHKILIGTIGAMGTGLTLTAGTVEIFMDEPWTMAAKSQAIDRCHRIGAKSNVTIYTLITKNTIDERIHQLVYKKGAMSDALIDGKSVGKDDIDYLLG